MPSPIRSTAEATNGRPLAAAVLAAGQARRFGRTKQLLRVRNEPLVARAARAALGSPAVLVVVVVGHDAARVRTALPRDPRLVTVENPDYPRGQGGSLRRAAEAVRERLGLAYLAVLLADMPRVGAAHLSRVYTALAEARSEGAPYTAARAIHEPSGTPGHPVVFSPEALDDLGRLPDGDDAPRVFLRTLDVLKVPFDDDGVIADIDTPDDAARE